MNNNETLQKLSMGKLWSLARSRGIEFKGVKKPELIKLLIAKDNPNTSEEPKIEEVKKETPKVEEKKAEKKVKTEDLVEATLADGTKVKIPAKDVKPAEIVEGEMVIIKSVDNRELEASIGRDHWRGKVIEVPAEQAEDVKRLLKDGGFYFV